MWEIDFNRKRVKCRNDNNKGDDDDDDDDDKTWVNFTPDNDTETDVNASDSGSKISCPAFTNHSLKFLHSRLGRTFRKKTPSESHLYIEFK